MSGTITTHQPRPCGGRRRLASGTTLRAASHRSVWCAHGQCSLRQTLGKERGHAPRRAFRSSDGVDSPVSSVPGLRTSVVCRYSDTVAGQLFIPRAAHGGGLRREGWPEGCGLRREAVTHHHSRPELTLASRPGLACDWATPRFEEGHRQGEPKQGLRGHRGAHQRPPDG